jgi:hypothetical protein
MNTMLKRLSVPAAAALSAGISAQLFGYRAFSRLVRTDVQALFAQASTSGAGVVTEEMLAGLPEPVRRYLTYTGIVGKPLVRTVYLRQQGKMRPGPGQPWIPLAAEEYYSVRPPGFVWDGTMHLGPLPIGRARDIYLHGKGHMLVKAASLFTVVDAKGQEMDQGSMMRYLSEMIWFPSAFLGDNVSFEAVDESSVRVTLTDHGRTATASMYFDRQGRLADFMAKRYRMVDGSSQLETWSTPVTAYGVLEGLRLPVRGKAVWKLADGDLDYIDITITQLQYDRSSRDLLPDLASKRRAGTVASGDQRLRRPPFGG